MKNSDFRPMSRFISEMKQEMAITNSAIFNDLEWPLTQISMARHYSTLNVSETVQDKYTVTTEPNAMNLYTVKIRMTFSDFEWRQFGQAPAAPLFNRTPHPATRMGWEREVGKESHFTYKQFLRSMTSLLIFYVFLLRYARFWAARHYVPNATPPKQCDFDVSQIFPRPW